MSDYTPTIGLEIHVELKTATKMFCNSKNDPDEKTPNINVCPVCMGHPGTLPTINKEAVKHVLRVGVAVGGEIADFTEFDRKNYFYPDIPKGYQISQYAYPLVKGGTLRGVALTRIHLEEDTARSQHGVDGSLVDFNRAGVPLMELVTEPVIHSAKEAGDFARELQLLLRTLSVSDADMEKGHMRVEVNISISKTEEFGTKTEVKNINSFRAAERAIEYEIERQTKLLEAGESVVQETRGWDETKQQTFSQRKKESSHDYRYFPEPDLPKLKISEIPEFSLAALKESLPQLPDQKRRSYQMSAETAKYELKGQNIEMFVTHSEYGSFFNAVVAIVGHGKVAELAANYIASDLVGLMGEDSGITISAEMFAKLMLMIDQGKLSSRGAKDVLVLMVREKGGDPETIAEKEGLLQQSDESVLIPIVEKIIAANPTVVADYKSGKEAALQSLVGQGMKETKGSGNPAVLKELFLKKI